MPQLIRRRPPRYYVDANLTSKIMLCLRHFGFSVGREPKNRPDGPLLAEIGQRPGFHPVWITGDLESQREHRQDILDSGVSVAWLRANHAYSTKQVLLALWFVIVANDELTESDRPLYFEVEAHVEVDNEHLELKRFEV